MSCGSVAGVSLKTSVLFSCSFTTTSMKLHNMVVVSVVLPVYSFLTCICTLAGLLLKQFKVRHRHRIKHECCPAHWKCSAQPKRQHTDIARLVEIDVELFETQVCHTHRKFPRCCQEDVCRAERAGSVEISSCPGILRLWRASEDRQSR